jgi:NADH-quinone oxidoreductase subunit G
VRACSEIQAVGAIDFVHRGAETTVGPAFGKQLSEGECVNCGLCATVCPTGALTPRSEIDAVWHALNDPTKTVVAQIAPAVRVGVGEAFGLEPGSIETGRLVAAMKALGFAQVYDTSFAADLTVIEEATEFLQRKAAGERLPQFTSCCPAWVKFAEQFCPEVLPNLSSCRSPQQMFGALARTTLPETLNVEPENLVIVSVMPCTAKKYEAKLPKFQTNGQPDVDHVLTTQELALMIEDAGLQFRQLAPESLDMPLGFKTGAGVIFGASGGVTEAVLRFAVEKVTGVRLTRVDFEEVRGERNVRKATITAGDTTLKLAMVHGLRNAQNLADKVARGEADYDLIEVMACPGGCIGGAGQPIPRELQTRTRRTAGLYEADKMLQLHKSQENHLVAECYDKVLGEVGGHRAHELLHTTYQNRRRIHSAGLTVLGPKGDSKVKVNVCLGTGCFLRGAHGLLNGLTERINQHGLAADVQVTATFCFEACDKGPTVRLGTKTLHRCTLDGAWEAVLQEVQAVPTA